jgi:hypothetical protein
MHQHNIKGHSMEPSGESGFSAKSCELAVQLNKSFLHEVFGQREIVHHAHANCEDPFLMTQVKRCECIGVASLGSDQNFVLLELDWRCEPFAP